RRPRRGSARSSAARRPLWTGRPRSTLRYAGPTEAVAIVRGIDDKEGAQWYDACWIDVGVAKIIVLLRVLDIDGIFHPGHLEQVAQIARQVRVVGDPPTVAL